MIRSTPPGQDPAKSNPRKVVADLELEPGQYASDLRVKGEVVIPQEILRPTLARIAGQLTNTENARVEFNAQTGRFEISGNYRLLWGLWKPKFKLELEAVNVEGKFGFKVAKFDHPGPSWPLDTYYLGRTARCTTDKGYPTTYDKRAKTLWVDADRVVHRWSDLSPFLRIDLGQTPLEVKPDGQGGIVVDMDAGEARTPTENRSRLRLNEYAMKAVFNEAFGEHFDVQQVAMSEGKFRLTGKARSAAMDGVVAFFALFALAAGQNPQIGDTRITAHVDVEQQGDKLLVRPDMGGQKVVNRIVEATRRRGLHAEARSGYAELDAGDVMKRYNIARMQLTPAGLMIDAATEPDAVIRPR